MHDFTDRHDCKISISCGDHSATRRDLDVDLIRDTEPRKKIGLKPNAAGASGNGDAFGLEQELFECLDGAQVRSRGPRSYRHAEGHARKIHVRFGGDSLRSDQLTKSLPREDNHIGRHTTGELRSNRLRPSSLRGTRPGRDFDAVRSNSGNNFSYAPLNPPD